MLTVITGPPCSGKSTYIQTRARYGDIIIDMDRIALALTTDGTKHHHYTARIRWTAQAARRAAIQQALTMLPEANIWLIHTDPTPQERAKYRALNASTIDLDPGIETVLARAANGNRPDDVIQYIHQWYAARPSHSNQLHSRAW